MIRDLSVGLYPSILVLLHVRLHLLVYTWDFGLCFLARNSVLYL